jgi:hypothetical protein
MKVHESHGLIPNQIHKKKEVSQQEDRTFSQLLDEVNTDRKSQGSEPRMPRLDIVPEGVLIVNDPGRVQPSGTGMEKSEILRQLEQTLDLVDFYASKLADGSFPVQDMDSLVGHLEERLDGLRTLEKDAGIPGKLKDIVSDTILTIGRETAKFRRGDYA